jgi:polysaccharide pyruvyl transferase
MKFAQLVCTSSRNIGDDIQSIAAARSLPRIDTCIDRERLDALEGSDPVCTIMNAWFMETDHWPPCALLRPIFVGFHVHPKKRALIAEHGSYLKRFEPIGSRDRDTAEFLNSLGVKAEVTYCLSLTFPFRTKPPVNGKVIIVDAEKIYIPRGLRRNAVRITHTVNIMSDATKISYAKDLIEFYRNSASLIITTRLHCALPCMAMGIPIVFFGDPTDSRTAIVSDVGGRIYNSVQFKKNLVGRTMVKVLDRVDWSPEPIDISCAKQRLLNAVSTRMDAICAGR